MKVFGYDSHIVGPTYLVASEELLGEVTVLLAFLPSWLLMRQIQATYVVPQLGYIQEVNTFHSILKPFITCVGKEWILPYKSYFRAIFSLVYPTLSLQIEA